jgi:hypothetical protein
MSIKSQTSKKERLLQNIGSSQGCWLINNKKSLSWKCSSVSPWQKQKRIRGTEKNNRLKIQRRFRSVFSTIWPKEKRNVLNPNYNINNRYDSGQDMEGQGGMSSDFG